MFFPRIIKIGRSSDIAKYGTDSEQIFILADKLKEKYGRDFQNIPPGAIGMITYFDRLNAGLQQFMAGARKFALKYITREDLVALTRESAEVSGIPYVMESDQDEVEKILEGKGGSIKPLPKGVHAEKAALNL